MKIQFKQNKWNKFVNEQGDLKDATYYTHFCAMLKEHNVSHRPCSQELIFESEEDAIIFILKFGL